MKTENIELAKGKGKILTEFLSGLSHFGGDDGLAAYHAACAVKSAMLRCGTDRQLRAVKKAVAQFNVMASIGTNERGLPAVRLFAPLKQHEIYL